jgi:hypothetical protein
MNPEISQSRMKWSEKAESTLQEYLESNFYQNPTILKDSIKTRITGGLEDVLPPRFHVRIIYDEFQNGKIIHLDSIYKVDFGSAAKTPENAKLVEVFDMEYKPPKKIDKNFAQDQNDYVYSLIQNIMCRQGFEKVVKESTVEALCVKSKSVGKLVDRGWVKMDYFTNKILQNENYDSLHLPISVTYVQPDSEFPDYSWISTKVWNLRNIPSDYSVEVFNPEGEQVKICSKPSVDSPQNPHSLNEWKFLLNSCGYSRIQGNYIVSIFSSNSLHETFVVNVFDKAQKQAN